MMVECYKESIKENDSCNFANNDEKPAAPEPKAFQRETASICHQQALAFGVRLIC